LYFVWALLFTPAGRLMVGAELILFTGAIAWLSISLKRRPSAWHLGAAFGRPGPLWGWLGLVAVSLTALFAFVNFSFRNPHGLWDAWAIWNLRARFLFRATTHWTDSFSPELFWSSPDYPLALPGVIANTWKFVGSESLWIPMAVALLFAGATVTVLIAGLRRLAGPRAAIVGGLCLLGTPLFVTHGASQYADVPLGFFMLAALVCFSFYDLPGESHPGWLSWAGLFTALAAWTKNEGLLFLVVIIGARGIIGLVRYGIGPTTTELRRFLTGALPILILLTVFKLTMAPTNGLFAIQDWSAVADKLADPSRYWIVLKSFAGQVGWFGNGMAVSMLIAALIVGPRMSHALISRLIPGLTVIVLMLFGYFLIYVITPQNLTWHLSTSIHRLLLQLWPSVILLFAAGVNPDSV